jgi:hypothetical protein
MTGTLSGKLIGIKCCTKFNDWEVEVITDAFHYLCALIYGGRRTIYIGIRCQSAQP